MHVTEVTRLTGGRATVSQREAGRRVHDVIVVDDVTLHALLQPATVTSSASVRDMISSNPLHST